MGEREGRGPKDPLPVSMSLTTLTDQNELVPASAFVHARYPFEHFNRVQSRVFEVHDRDCNCVIAAPTGVGKTICAELFMAHEVRERGGKAIYLAPLRALAKEKIDEWTSPGSVFDGLKVAICTGDYRLTEARHKELEEADVIVMTSEMLSSRCRNMDSEKNEFLKACGTIVVDESHLLTVPGRGDHLEVGLMKFSKVARDPRIVFLSATMPNVDEIANWVGCSLVKKDTYLVVSDYRPCPLDIHYEEYEVAETYDQTEEYKAERAVDLIREYKDDKFLVFVHSKATGERIRSALADRRIECEFHNADLEKEKRHAVEDRFKHGDLRVLIATSTVAWGCYRHGSRVVLPDGSLKDVAELRVGDELLCPVKDGFKSRKVVRTKDFDSDSGYFIKLECGDTMTVSDDHVFLSAKGRSSPNWNRVSSLSKGDFVAVPSDLKIWREEVGLDRFWYLVGFIFGDGCLVRSGSHADGSEKITIDICLGKMDSLANQVIRMFYEEFGVSGGVRNDTNGIPHLVTKKKSTTDRLKEILPIGRKNGTNDIPNSVYGDQSRVKSFLRGLFDSDGGTESNSNGNVSVGLTNISEKAVESVRTLLLGFGIRSSFGRKKIKPSVIKGRLQNPVRDYCYRLRVFGRTNLEAFRRHIGFGCPSKASRLDDFLATSAAGHAKDLVPARELLCEYVGSNNLKAKDFRNITGGDLYNSLNTQDCARATIEKLVSASPKKTRLNDVLEKPYYWARVKELQECKGGKFREIEVESPHAYVGCGAISHNCNLPARRVIIAGVHRGMTEVETYDIFQMAGRAGRPGYDPRGDVYILVPNRNPDHHIERLSVPKKIESQLLNHTGSEDDPHYKTLAFHLVSDIHHGSISCMADVHDWYARSLAYFQYKELDDSIADKTIDLLLRVGAIKEEGGRYEVTSVGKVSSMLYYSPFDVADLRRNFKHLFANSNESNDLAVAMALGNVDSIRSGFVTRAEKEEMEFFAVKFRKAFGDWPDGTVKGAYAYHCLLNGSPLGPFASMARGLQMDFDRLASVLNLLDSMAAKWNRGSFFRDLSMRVSYGVRTELVDLCRIPNVGKVRAEKLFAAGFRRPSDLLADPQAVKRVLNMKDDRVAEMLAHIRGS